MKKQIVIYKGRGLYGKFLSRLKELETEVRGISKERFIPYSYIYLKLCRNFSMKKRELKEIIFFLRDLGILEISQVGAKLNIELKNGN